MSKATQISDAVFSAFGIPAPQREFPFHPTRKWRIDFAWPSRKLAVEIDGGIWTNGSHSRGSGLVRNMEKRNAMAVMGWRLLCYTPQLINMTQIREAVNE